MRVVREAWESTGGRVLGLAPSAAAASVLGDELGVRADTLHSLVLAQESGGEVDVRGHAAGRRGRHGGHPAAGPGTRDRRRTRRRGAAGRDYRQLAAVEAGGALRLIHSEVGGTELTQVHRFRDPAEAAAVLALRVGDPASVDFYADRERLHDHQTVRRPQPRSGFR